MSYNQHGLPCRSMPLISTPCKSEASENFLASSRVSLITVHNATRPRFIDDQPAITNCEISSTATHNFSLTNVDFSQRNTTSTIDVNVVIPSTNSFHLSSESRQMSQKMFDFNAASSSNQKKSSPLKVVTPILRKYSTHRISKKNRRNICPQFIFTSEPTVEPPPQPQPQPLISASLIQSTNDIDPPECATDNGVNKFDNEEDLAALMVASSTVPRCLKRKQHVNKKKRIKELREAKVMLSMLSPDSDAFQKETSDNIAQAFFTAMRERLIDNEDTLLFEEILRLMSDFDTQITTVKEFYDKMNNLLVNYPDLAEQFVIFLHPEQALECGKFIEYHKITNISSFIKKMKIFFAKQPQQFRIVFAALENLSEQETLTTEELKSNILPLLKGNSLLVDSFLRLLPDEPPPESMMQEFEDMEVDSDRSCNEDETVYIPDQLDPYGSDKCVCECHVTQEEKYRTRHLHCVSCGTKFIRGKVYLPIGRSLRPAKVAFPGYPNQSKRIYVKICPKVRGRKKETTPTKIGNADDRRTEMHSNDDPKILSPKTTRVTKSKAANSTSKARAVTLSSTSVHASKTVPIDTSNVKTLVTKTAVLPKNKPLTEPTLLQSFNHHSDSTSILNVGPTPSSLQTCKSIASQDDTGSDNISTQVSIDSNINIIHMSQAEPDVTASFSVNNNEYLSMDAYFESAISGNFHSGTMINVQTDSTTLETRQYLPIETYCENKNVYSDSSLNVRVENHCVDSNESSTMLGLPASFIDRVVNIDERNLLNSFQLDYSCASRSTDNEKYIEFDKYYEGTASRVPEANVSIEIEADEGKRGAMDFCSMDDNWESLMGKTAETVPTFSDAQDCGSISEVDCELKDLPKSVTKENLELPSSSKVNVLPTTSMPWTKDEDKVILLEVQRGYSLDKTFQNIKGLPQRSLEEIRGRFHMLMTMLQEMTLPKEDDSCGSSSFVNCGMH